MLKKFNELYESIVKVSEIKKKECFKVFDLTVYKVSGDEVRNLRKKHEITAEFIGGGHALVYHFIPKREIWLEKI